MVGKQTLVVLSVIKNNDKTIFITDKKNYSLQKNIPRRLKLEYSYNI